MKKIILSAYILLLFASCTPNKNSQSREVNNIITIDSTTKAIDSLANIQVDKQIGVHQFSINLENAKKQLHEEDYLFLSKVNKQLSKKNSNVCQLNNEVDNILLDTREEAKEKYPEDITKQNQYSLKNENLRIKKLLKKYNITAEQQTVITFIFSKSSSSSICN